MFDLCGYNLLVNSLVLYRQCSPTHVLLPPGAGGYP